MFAIVVLAGVMTWFIPGGEYQRTVVTTDGVSREVVDGNSFTYVENSPQTWQIFSAIFEGFVDKADIIVFIFLIGGAFWIMNQTKAIDIGIKTFLQSAQKLEKHKIIKKIGVHNITLTLIMLMFSVFGAVFGMSEETIAFVIIFVPLAINMGFDSITGVSICFVAAGLGFAGAILNPFTIGIAQGLSDLPLFSGAEYRLFCWIVINVIGISYILYYANKIRRNPKKSAVYEDDKYWREHHNYDNDTVSTVSKKYSWITHFILIACLTIFSLIYHKTTLSLGTKEFSFAALPIITVLFAIFGIFAIRKSVHFYIMHLLGFTIVFLIVGVMGYQWYITEIATLFFVMGIASGVAYGFSYNTISKHFLDGVKDILSAGLIVGLAGGIIIILQNGKIIDTMLHSIAGKMENWGDFTSVGFMYFIQTTINLFMPSGSAKAALTMPIMSQFSDLVGISRQATVMAFQFGDGFTNMITPTSGVLMAVLGVAKIPYAKWVKWIFPFMIVLVLLGLLLLIPTVTMDLNGF